MPADPQRAPGDRGALRKALLDAYPWLGATDAGPRAVDAGPCDRCDEYPRLLPICGPGAWQAVCRDCAVELGADGWCDGHAEEGAAAREWAARLPDEWPRVVTLWWVATGEVHLDPASIRGQGSDRP